MKYSLSRFILGAYLSFLLSPLVFSQAPVEDKAMVVSAHPLASEVGAKIMKEGGNAYDAAIAVQFALAVVYPVAGNIGGGGFLVYRHHTGEVGSLDYREKAPLAASRDMYLDENKDADPQKSRLGHLAAGVPGTVDGMVKIHKRLASLPWEKLLQPAIALARDGFELTDRHAQHLNRSLEQFAQVNDPLPVMSGQGKWKGGDILKQEDLAMTLERIRDQGREGFYAGKTADLIVAEMKRGGGIMRKEDLIRYQSVWRTPLEGEYRGYRLISMPPPSSGGICMLQMLQMIEKYDLNEIPWHSDKMVQLLVEAERRAYADRAKYMGDGDYFPVPVLNLLDPDYVQKRFANFSFGPGGRAEKMASGLFGMAESEETTHFSIVDPMGNAVSMTTTLNGGYGSKVVVKGAGFLLNNEMDDFSAKPGFPNLYGLVGGEANAIEPGKRMLSSMTPTILEKDGNLFMVVGTPGGSTIITSVMQTIINVIDYGMDMQEAVNAKRFHHQWKPDFIFVEEEGIDEEVREKMKSWGYDFKGRGAIGRVDAIKILPNGKLEGGADPRGEDKAVGF